MNNRIKQLATIALSGDKFPKCVTYKATDTENFCSIGKSIASYLKLQPIEFRDNEYICDRYRFSGMNAPSDYYRSLSPERARYWGRLSCGNPTDIFYWGWTHVALDYGYILNNGLRTYYRRINESVVKYKEDNEKTEFLNGMVYCLDGICERYRMIGQKAAELVQTESDPDHKLVLERLADSFSRIPMNPAKTFFDAVQFTWLAFLLAPDSLGRIDQYLLPFFRHDIESGIITNDFAFELLEELFIKVHESQADNTALDISGHNHLVVGGYLKNGEDGFNELSKVILEAIADLPTYRPQASFRYTDKTSLETMRYITELNRRCQLIVFVNDEPRIRGMMECGFSHDDAVEYTVIGCNEWAITGKSKLDLAHISLIHPLEKAIYEYGTVSSYDELYNNFVLELKKDFDVIIDEYARFAEVQRGEHNILTSIFHDDCIENARSFTNMGVRYYGLTMSFNSISNAADSLSVIKQFVFDEKLFTYDELLCALRNNWNGYEDMRTLILKKGRFFGNDDDYVDSIAKDIVNSIYDVKLQIQTPYIKNLVVGSFVGGTNPNIILGKRTKATPDGRYNGDEYTMGIGQSRSKDKNGITALLSSIAKLDYTKLCGCVVSNLKMDKTMADTPEKLDKLAELYYTFLRMGGMQLQINYISTEELIEAQNNPDKYSNLMVRVTGYSGFFTRFSKDLQNDIIERTSQTC